MNKLQLEIKKAERFKVTIEKSLHEFAEIILVLVNEKSSRRGILDIKTIQGTQDVIFIVEKDTNYDYKSYIESWAEAPVVSDGEVYYIKEDDFTIVEWLAANATDEFGYIKEMMKKEEKSEYYELYFKVR